MKNSSTVAAVVAIAAAGAAWAQEETYAPAPAFRSQQKFIELHAGLTYTDNVFLTETNKSNDELASVGFDIDYTRKGRKLNVDANGALDWIQYLQSTYGGNAYGKVNGSAVWGRATDWFQWRAEDTFGQLSPNPLAASTPANVENVNYFTTGPQLNFGVGRDTRLSVYGLYSKTNYQKSPYDSDTELGGMSLGHALSPLTNIALNADAERTHFANHFVATDTDLHSASASYDSTIARTRLSAAAGYETLHYRGVTSGGPLMSLQIDRRISYASTVFVRARSQFSTAADSLRSGLDTTRSIGAFAASTPNPFTERIAALGWSAEYPRTALSLVGSYERRRYEQNTEFNSNTRSLEAALTRQLRPLLAATLSARYDSQRYENLGADINDTLLSAALSRQIDRVGLSARYEWRHRTSSGVASTLRSQYDENRIGVYVSYMLVGHRSPQ